jgi:hypothetical protein
MAHDCAIDSGYSRATAPISYGSLAQSSQSERVLQTLALPLGDDAEDFDFTGERHDPAFISSTPFNLFAKLAT